MKIWHSLPLSISTQDLLSAAIRPDQEELGYILTYQIPRFTRLRKTKFALAEMERHASSTVVPAGIPLGIWIHGRGDNVQTLFEHWREISKFPDALSCFVRSVHKRDDVPEPEHKDRELNRSTFIEIGQKYDPHNYEKLFYALARNGYRGIAVDVENIKRSTVTLAHRFDLECIVTGVVHERHEELALKSQADQFFVY